MTSSSLAGLVIALLGWYAPRLVASTRFRWSSILLLDLAMPAALFALVAALTARPVFAGVMTLAIGAAYAYADRSKRLVLREPIVFTDVFQAPDIFRHPELALPFPHKGRIAAGVLLGISFFILIFAWEAAAWTWAGWHPLAALFVILVAAWIMANPANRVLGHYLRTQRPSEDPFEDAARLGPFATLLAYGILARAERSTRQLAVARTHEGPSESGPKKKALPPVVAIQCESFFDARRLHPQLASLHLPTLDACRAQGAQWGRLSVPTWGANTVRTEFAVLSGLEQSALGLDRFNPYHRFARHPITSLAWKLKAQGYKTICLHPFDRNFYGRNFVLPNMGFDEFIGEEAFAEADRVNSYVTDMETARVGCEILARESGPVFLFVITMENHGPWPSLTSMEGSHVAGLPNLPADEREGLDRYLQSLENADRMLERFTHQVQPGGLVAFYGDHLPSFPGSFKRLGLSDMRSDYLVWRAGAQPATHQGSVSSDIDASALGGLILQNLSPCDMNVMHPEQDVKC